MRVDGLTSSGNTALGVSFAMSGNGVLKNVSFVGNTTYGISFVTAPENIFINLTTSGNTSGSIQSSTAPNCRNYFFNYNPAEATAIAGFVNYEDNRYISIGHGGVATTHHIYTDGGLISSETTVRHTASGIAWKLSPTATTRDSVYPLTQRIFSVPVKANVEVTLSIWLRRNNSGIDGKLRVVCPEIAGINTALETSGITVVDTWEQHTITFTPTLDAVLPLEVTATGGTTYSVYWDDFSIITNSRIDTSSGDYPFLLSGAYVGDKGISGAGTETVGLFV